TRRHRPDSGGEDQRQGGEQHQVRRAGTRPQADSDAADGGQSVSGASCHASFTVPPRAGPPRTRLPHGKPTSPACSPTQPAIWCMIWCMVRTNIYLEERQTAILDQIPSDEGAARAEVIRLPIEPA